MGYNTMSYGIKNTSVLRKLLWADAFLGGSTAIIGLLFSSLLTEVLGLSRIFILVVSAVTLLYALVAFTLARQKAISIAMLKLLINANWGWSAVSGILLFVHADTATPLGIAFLIAQVIVVSGLAFLENRQLIKL